MKIVRRYDGARILITNSAADFQIGQGQKIADPALPYALIEWRLPNSNTRMGALRWNGTRWV